MFKLLLFLFYIKKKIIKQEAKNILNCNIDSWNTIFRGLKNMCSTEQVRRENMPLQNIALAKDRYNQFTHGIPVYCIALNGLIIILQLPSSANVKKISETKMKQLFYCFFYIIFIFMNMPKWWLKHYQSQTYELEDLVILNIF